jgi:Tfp pilus assembly protein FimT
MMIGKFIRRGLAGNAGFSLAELIIVIGMICMIGAVSLPSLLSWRNGHYYRQAANGILLELRRARSTAIAGNMRNMVVITPTSRSFQTFSSSTVYSTPATSWGLIPMRNSVVNSKVTIRSGATGTSTATVYVKFNPDGTAQMLAPDNTTVSDSNISVNDNTTQKFLISVFPTGRILMQSK